MNWLPLNIPLMANPMNWLIVFLVVLIWGLAIGLIFHPANVENVA